MGLRCGTSATPVPSRSVRVAAARNPKVAVTSSRPPPGGTGMRPSFDPGYPKVCLSNRTTCSPIQIESRPIPSTRWPKSRIISGVALGDMNVEKTPILMQVLLLSVGRWQDYGVRRSRPVVVWSSHGSCPYRRGRRGGARIVNGEPHGRLSRIGPFHSVPSARRDHQMIAGVHHVLPGLSFE